MKLNTALVSTCIALCGALAAGPALAADYYVATTGSNSNPGTEALPWATLQYAAGQVGAGDTVTVEDGTYSTSGSNFAVPAVNPSRSGTASAPITFKARNQWAAILDRGTGQAGAIGSSGADYIVVDGFQVIGGGPKGIEFFGSGGNRVVGCVARNMWIHGMRGPAQDNTDGIRSEYTDGCTYENNLIEDVLNPGTSSNAAGIKLYNTINVTIQDNEIRGCVSGIKEKEHGTNNIFRRNKIHDMTGESYGIVLNSQNGDTSNGVYIYENQIWGVKVGIGRQDVPGNDVTNIVIHNNVIDGATSASIMTLTPNYEVQIYNNIFVRSPTPSIGGVVFTQQPYTDVLTYMDYNLWSNENGTVVYSNRAASPNQQYSSLASWTSASGYSSHAVVGDPQFADAANHDYRLCGSSPGLFTGRDGEDMGAFPGVTPPCGDAPPAPPTGVSVEIQ